MKKILNHFRVVPFFIFLVVVPFLSVTVAPVEVVAQTQRTAISGDEVCGKWNPSFKNPDGSYGSTTKPCSIKTFGSITKNILGIIMILGLPLLVVFVSYRFVMAYFAAIQGNATAYKDAIQKSSNAVLGFIFIVALFGGLMFTVLKYLGVKDGGDMNPLLLLKLFSEAFVPHVYAAGSQLPNPLGASDLYSLILSILRVIMRFFIYPALIVMWVWTGFSFVLAQGRPDALTKAKSWFVRAFVSTLVIVLLQTFLIAVQGTVNKILPTQTQVKQGDSCLLDKRIPGTIDENGECRSNSAQMPSAEAIANDPRFSPTYCSSCIKLTGASAAISGGATLSGTVQGYSYYSDGTVIGPDGTYYKDDKPIWSPPVYTCPDGKTKYYDQFDYRIICSTPSPSVSSYVDPCPSLNQVHSSCTAQNGKPGTCLLDVFTKPKAPYFVCIPK